MSELKFNAAKDWFEKLRNKIISSIENIESEKFFITEWNHKDKGGGKMSKIKGKIIEKGGVNISSVSGNFNKKMLEKIPGTKNDSSYKATGISVVLHPHSPHIPSMHFNTRFLQTEEEWFGGGMDITPCLNFAKEKEYHSSLESLCNKFDSNYCGDC